MSAKTNVYPPGTFKYLGTFQRGATIILGNGVPPLKFGDEKTTSKKHVLVFDMSDPVKREQYEAAVKSEAFKKGTIVYIESPEELKAKAKAKKQKETLESYRNMLKTGIFQLTEIRNKKMKALIAFADQIGAEYEFYNAKNKQIQPYRKEIILKNIYDLLGDIEPDKEMEVKVPKKPPAVTTKEVSNVDDKISREVQE